MLLVLKALGAQLAGALLVLVWLTWQPAAAASPLLLAFAQGIAAAGASYLLRAERWWMLIHLAFMPAVVGARRLELPPAWFLGGFLLLAAIYWSSFRSRVPLYLSNRTTTDALLTLLPRQDGLRLVDVGAGTGGVLKRLAHGRPDARLTGIEHAPLPWLMAWLATRGMPNCTVKRGDFWQHSLAEYDVLYAFLSPVPMKRLWQKARREMRPGALFISNSFPVPEVTPQQVLEVHDSRGTQLYCYRL